MGRPIEWTEDRIAAAKELYLQLVAQGMSEHKIDAVDAVPVWSVRYGWQDDPEFLTRLQVARKSSASTRMSEAQRILEDAHERAQDDAASPQLITAANNLAKFHHLIASKLDRELWGDRQQIDQRFVDKSGNDIQVNVNIGSKSGE